LLENLVAEALPPGAPRTHLGPMKPFGVLLLVYNLSCAVLVGLIGFSSLSLLNG
jgi:hypothetical protein